MLNHYPAHLDDTLFGHITGHLAPGTMFILMGFWWLYNVAYDIRVAQIESVNHSRPYISRVWYGLRTRSRNQFLLCKYLLEPFTKICLSLVGVLMEITGAHWALFDSKGNFEADSINNFSHATMFAFFGLSGIVDILQHFGILNGKILWKLGHVTMATAFFVEGILFYFHLDGRSALDSHSHSIIYSLCFATCLVFIFESIWLNSGLLGIARCFLVILQGMWFYQIAFMLYGPRRWSEKSASSAMFVPIAFTWHCLFLMVAVIIFLIVIEKCFRNSRYCSAADCEELSMNLLAKEEEDGATSRFEDDERKLDNC